MHGQVLDTVKSKKAKLKLEPGLEYLTPVYGHRSIQTISANVFLGGEYFKKTPLTIYCGLTVTYAWGTIIQYNDNFIDETYKNQALGLGPVFLIRFEPIAYKGFSLAPEFSGGFILYSNKFPYGGEIYNFMWRVGGSICYRINTEYSVTVNSRWMHVSNGKGLVPQNPSYEGWGLGIGFIKYFQL